jgi:hypothetical protein
MFRPTWRSSGVYDISLFIPEGISEAGIKSEILYTPEDRHVGRNM